MADASRRLAPLQTRIARAARAAQKPQYVLEKDYALSHILAGIAAVPGLRQSLVFKGSTCLRKAYFRNYRFSEDLDFSLRSPMTAGELLEGLTEAAQAAIPALEEHGPFRITVEMASHRNAHPAGQIDCRIRVQFPWMSSPQCAVKVEVTTDEPVLKDPSARPLIHDYEGESLDAAVATYDLEEIAAEKLRGFLQKREELRKKGWARNRPRDLYDLWYLRRQTQIAIQWEAVGHLLPAKAEARGVA